MTKPFICTSSSFKHDETRPSSAFRLPLLLISPSTRRTEATDLHGRSVPHDDSRFSSLIASVVVNTPP
jgi:hypothetical protein